MKVHSVFLSSVAIAIAAPFIAVSAPADAQSGIPRQNSAVIGSASTTSDTIEGGWGLTIRGSEYGPFKSRRQAFMFSKPDRNGVVVGHAPGGAVMFIGAQQAGSRNVRGVWMEKAPGTTFQTTGRWGLMEARLGGEPASSMDIRMSVGYRAPDAAWAVNNPGMPGMQGRGSRLSNEAVQMPTVRTIQGAWEAMVRKPSPYSAIHGIWPTSKINTAIQAWVRGETQNASFGGSRSVDPCAAKCMGKEPENLLVRLLALYGIGERRTEFYGNLRAKVDVVNARGRMQKAVGDQSIFQRPRNNAIKRQGQGFGVVGPPMVGLVLTCEAGSTYPSLGQANFKLPSTAWSDPNFEIIVDPVSALVEKDLAKGTDDQLQKVINSRVAIKKNWQFLSENPSSTGSGSMTAATHPDTPCHRYWGKANSDNRRNGAEFQLMIAMR